MPCLPTSSNHFKPCFSSLASELLCSWAFKLIASLLSLLHFVFHRLENLNKRMCCTLPLTIKKGPTLPSWQVPACQDRRESTTWRVLIDFYWPISCKNLAALQSPPVQVLFCPWFLPFTAILPRQEPQGFIWPSLLHVQCQWNQVWAAQGFCDPQSCPQAFCSPACTSSLQLGQTFPAPVKNFVPL